MSSLHVTIQQPVTSLALTQEESPELKSETLEENSTGLPSAASNSSGLLQNFVLPKSTLDAMGLLRPSNQGDGEIQISQAFLTSERLKDEHKSLDAEVLSSFAAAQARILKAIQALVAPLEAENAVALETIAENKGRVEQLDTEIAETEQDFIELEGRKQSLMISISVLEDATPQTDDIAAQLHHAREELAQIDTKLAEVLRTLEGLNAEKTKLSAENDDLMGEIDGRTQEISRQTQLVDVISFALERLVTASSGPNPSVEDAQQETASGTGEIALEEILPQLQQLFEIDIEDAGLEETIAGSRLSDRDIEEAVIVSFGLAGSFIESLGVFLQHSNLIELDLQSAMMGNNKSQRMQISI